MFIKRKKAFRITQEEFDKAIYSAYKLGYRLRQTEYDNRGFIIGKLDQELKDILRQKT